MGTILKVKSGGSFISVPAIIGPQGPQGPAGPQGDPGDVSDVLVNGNSVVSSGIATINIVDLVYPIGSIYMSVNGVNPGSLLGGTWVPWGTGRVPVGVDTTNTNFNTVEKVGGSASLQAHTHSVSITTGNNSVGHTHSISLTTGNQSAGHTHTFSGTTGNQSQGHTHGFTTGSSGDHSHNVGRDRDVAKGSANWSVHVAGTSGAGGTSPTNSTGGHTHSGTTGDINAGHNHGYSGTTSGISANHTHSWSGNSGGISANHTHSVSGNTGSTGSGDAENLQPYITCYMWKRTA